MADLDLVRRISVRTKVYVLVAEAQEGELSASQMSELAGALASKICGAGGGGCMITLAAEGRRKEVETAVGAAGAQVLPFHIARQGLTVKEV